MVFLRLGVTAKNQFSSIGRGEMDIQHLDCGGGVRVVEPAADLALALALVSAQSGVALPDGLVACGEVGLAGEVRQAAHTSRRLAEAARLGFTRAVVSASSPEPPAGLEGVRVATLAEAVHRLRLFPGN